VVDVLSRVLGFVLRPRGRALPAGEHFSADPSFSAFGWPEDPVVFQLTTYSADMEPIGTYVATADAVTSCSVDGREVGLRELLDAIGEPYAFARVVAEQPGRLAAIELSVRDSRDVAEAGEREVAGC
jgi:hypothetical protein